MLGVDTSQVAGALADSHALDDDGWLVCTSARHSVPLGQLRAALAGDAPTSALPEDVAAALLTRTSDPALVDPADHRPAVVAAVERFAPGAVQVPEVDPAVVVAALGELLYRYSDAAAGTDVPGVLYHLGRAADSAARDWGEPAFAVAVLELLGGDGPAFGCFDTSSFAHMFVLAHLLLSRKSSTRVAFTARVPEMSELLAAAFVAAELATNSRATARAHRDAAVYLAAAKMAAAAELDPDDAVVAGADNDARRALGQDRCCTALRAAIIDAGGALFGPGSLAELYGFGDDLEALDPADAATLVRAAPGDSECVSVFLDAWTAGGTRRRPVPGLAVSGGKEVPWRVALAASDPAVATKKPKLFADTVIARTAEEGTDTADVLAAVAAEPELHAALLAGLPHAGALRYRGRAGLEAVVAESMRTVGLAPWVTATHWVRDELTEAAAGIGVSRWTVVVELLAAGFRGTPGELVELTGTVAPAT